MARLYDKIMQGGIRIPGINALGERPGPEVASIMSRVHQPIVLDASNVLRYWFDIMRPLKDGRLWQEMNLRDFPNVAPPFSEMFIEGNLPFWLRQRNVLPDEDWPLSQGVLMVSAELKEEGQRQGWAVETAEFMEYPDGVYLRSSSAYDLSADGAFQFTTRNTVFFDHRLYAAVHYKTIQGKDAIIANDLRLNLYPFFLALSFLHCKNVRQVENVPPPKLSRAHEKRHGRPLVKYYTLEIDPMKEVLRREGRSETAGLKKALHICRGHFANYTEKGLFGKYFGQFWRPSHVRGTLEQGAVVKDYNVKAPR